jgi:hypothetical protein
MDDELSGRRKFPRIPSENPVLVNRLGEDALEAVTKTRVVGLGGCMFASPESFGPGALLQILVTVEGAVVDCLARVVYELDRDSHYEIGVEFLFLNEAKLRQLRTLFPDLPDLPSDRSSQGL